MREAIVFIDGEKVSAKVFSMSENNSDHHKWVQPATRVREVGAMTDAMRGLGLDHGLILTEGNHSAHHRKRPDDGSPFSGGGGRRREAPFALAGSATRTFACILMTLSTRVSCVELDRRTILLVSSPVLNPVPRGVRP